MRQAVRVLAAVRKRIAQVPQRPGFFLRDDFQVGNRGQQFRVPVDQAPAAVDQTLPIQFDEYPFDQCRQIGVHGESLARPVERGAHAAQLPGNDAAVFFLPVPDALDESLASDLFPAGAFGVQLPLDHHLGRNAGVVGADLPQGVAPEHAMVTDQGVHDGKLEAVAHVQPAGDVRRRNRDAIGFAVSLRREIAGVLPCAVPAVLDVPRFEGLVHFSPFRPGSAEIPSAGAPGGRLRLSWRLRNARRCRRCRDEPRKTSPCSAKESRRR